MSFEFANYMVRYKDSKTASSGFSLPPHGGLAGLPAFRFLFIVLFFSAVKRSAEKFPSKVQFYGLNAGRMEISFPRGKNGYLKNQQRKMWKF